MAASIYDVAKRAGVSISTVSRILNGSANVSEKKTKAVQEAMEFYHYEPNQFGRGLVKQQSGMIGVYFPSAGASVFESSYNLELLKGIEKVVSWQNYSMVLISEADEYRSRVKSVPKYLEFIRQKKIDGLLLSGLNDKAMKEAVFQQIMDEEYPVVYIGKRFHRNGLNIYAQLEQYSIRMLEVLCESGHRSVLYYFWEAHRQYLGDILAQAAQRMPQMKVYPVMLEKLIPDRDVMLQSIQKYTEEAGCTAICSPAMETTQVILGLCAQLGLTVPERVSVLSVEHTPGAGQLLYPGISAFYVPAQDMGSGAADLLLRSIRGMEIEEPSVEYETKFLERDSIRRLS